LNVLGFSIVLGLVGRHPVEKVGERGCGSGGVPIIGSHVEGAVGFGYACLAEMQLNSIICIGQHYLSQ